MLLYLVLSRPRLLFQKILPLACVPPLQFLLLWREVLWGQRLLRCAGGVPAKHPGTGCYGGPRTVGAPLRRHSGRALSPKPQPQGTGGGLVGLASRRYTPGLVPFPPWTQLQVFGCQDKG